MKQKFVISIASSILLFITVVAFGQQYPGDANSDGIINILDATFILSFLCSGGPAPDPLANGDANGDCIVDINDVRAIIFDQFWSQPYYCMQIVDSTCEYPDVGPCEEQSFNLLPYTFADPVLITCPMADMPFRIHLRNEDSLPVSGTYSIWLELHDVSEMEQCDGSSLPSVICSVGSADSLGRITFYLDGSICPDNGYAVIFALGLDGTTTNVGVIDTVPIKTFDTNGDHVVSYLSDFVGDSCNDYNGNGAVTVYDANIFNSHLGHNCGADPCQLFYANFQLIPESNLQPGDEITLRVTIENNSLDTCYVGALDIYESPFASGINYNLFTTINYNDNMYPGKSDTIETTYTVPDDGQGCLKAVINTECCVDPVNTVPKCFQSIQHCLIDSNVCYQFRISLDDNFPIENILFNFDSLGQGWTFVEDYIPDQFPIMTTDSIKYSICTPNLSDLGDSAKVLVYVCHDAACSQTDIFESNVVISSRTGDTNGDCMVNVSDAVFIINYVFTNGPDPLPYLAGDVNCDDDVNISDAVWLINFVFIPGSPPPCLPAIRT